MNEALLYIIVGDNIRTIREKRGLSQLQLAVRCGFEKSNMSRIEAGRTNLTIKNIWKISVALGVSMMEIVDISVWMR